MGRTTRGVKAIELNEGDCVVSAVVAEEGKDILAVTENGYGKRTKLEEYRVQTRGGKGIFTYKLTEKTGDLIGLVSAPEESDVMLITSDGTVIRMHVDEISVYGRQTQGVRLMKLEPDVTTVSLALTEREEEQEIPDDAEEDAVSEENQNEMTEEAAPDGEE